MCTITTWMEPKIAEKDITVYKILDNYLRSVHTRFQYEFGKLYSTEMESVEDMCTYDSHDTNYLDSNISDWRSLKKVKSIGPGFHSALKPSRLTPDNESEYIFMCKIPKGSLYYEGVTNLIVSNQIIIVKKYR